MLFQDPNSPGLRFCEADLDVFDPYRLPARQTENIALPFTRPDEPLTFDVNAVSNNLRPPGDFLLSGSSGTGVINLSWTPPSAPVSSWRIYRRTDTGAFVLIASDLPVLPRTYADSAGIDRSAHDYQYYATYIEAAFGIESLPSNTVTFPKLNALVALDLGIAAPRSMRSLDGGLTWQNIVNLPLAQSLSNFSAGMAYSPSRGRLVISSGVSALNNIAYTDDLGLTWNLANNHPNFTSNNMIWTCYASWLDHFFAGGFFNSGSPFPYIRSTDGGINWAIPATTGAGNGQPSAGMYAIPELQILLMWTGNQMWRSSNGVDWSQITVNVSAQPHDAGNNRTTYNYNPVGNNAIWCGTSDGHFYNLPNPAAGSGAQLATIFGGSSFIPMAWSPDLSMWMALDHSTPLVARSTDNGTSWPTYTPPTDFPTGGTVIWCRSSARFVVVGSRNVAPGPRCRAGWSTDGINWTSQIIDATAGASWGTLIECR
jgi:hypothetical protein